MAPAGGADTGFRAFSLGRRYRLASAGDFSRVFGASRRSADRLFTVLYRDNDYDRPRLGFAIAKKRVNRAVVRNRLRRLVRESFRHRRETLGNVDIVVMAKALAADATNPEIHRSLDEHWRRIEGDNDSPPKRTDG